MRDKRFAGKGLAHRKSRVEFVSDKHGSFAVRSFNRGPMGLDIYLSKFVLRSMTVSEISGACPVDSRVAFLGVF